MGILNVTPDSFSDGGSSLPLDERISRLIQDGADMLDIGGESTRPGSAEVPVEEELKRVLPALQTARRLSGTIPISIDTRKSSVAEAALDAGADIINDVSGLLYDSGMAKTIARYSAGVVIMHARSTPEQMQSAEHLSYPDGLIPTVSRELGKMLTLALNAGISPDSIVLDPGIGFAKTAEQSAELIREGRAFLKMGYPLLSGPSRKSFIGTLTGVSKPDARDFGTCGAIAASVLSGYSILRVHQVKAASDCLKVFLACTRSGELLF